MAFSKLPIELRLEIGDALRTSDYAGFWTYLNLRLTNRELHDLYRPLAYADLAKDLDMFIRRGLLPCSRCLTIRDKSHFFNGEGRDGIGKLPSFQS